MYFNSDIQPVDCNIIQQVHVFQFGHSTGQLQY